MLVRSHSVSVGGKKVPMSVHARMSRRLIGAAAATTLVLVGVVGTATSASARPVLAGDGAVARATVPPQPQPKVPDGLPKGIENLATFVPADSCDPTVKPGTEAFGDLLTKTYPGTSYGITRVCGTDALPTSEHYDGRALDWMVSASDPKQKAQADAVLSWLFATDAAGDKYANARRLGIMYVIWDNRIWGAYRSADGWRPYSSCASHPEASHDTTCHRNHVHFSLSWEGAMGRTSFWTKSVAAPDYGPCRASDMNWATPDRQANPTPCPSYAQVLPPKDASGLDKTLTAYSGMWLTVGSTGPVVSAVQQAVGAPVDGVFGSSTAQTLRAWQQAHGLHGTGVVTLPTWRALLKANAPAVQPPASVTRTSNLARFSHLVLRRGSTGAAVKALQRRLHVHADGVFGAHTEVAVNRFKRNHHMPVDGVVRRGMWCALGAC
jgi:hypothetical protein